MNLPFYKYQGTGNDFIILNNFDKIYQLTIDRIRFLCDRKFGVGADGLMLLNPSNKYDFEMEYYNADGRESTMCGNGGRCLAKFARHQKFHKNNFVFTAIDGVHEAVIQNDGWVYLKMKNVNNIEKKFADSVLDTGSPHYVHPVADARNIDVYKEGKAIRYNHEYKEEGINVNFVEQEDNDDIYVRTYERGVENETLSCGTGVVASALVFAHNESGFNRVNVETPGGKLAVEFDKTGDNKFENIWLCGPAEFVFAGTIDI